MTKYTNALTRTLKVVRDRGPVTAFKQWWTIHDAKPGAKVGEDEFGNQYFENLSEEHGRERWVEYKQWSWPGPADTVTAEWHGWLHKMHDTRQTTDVPRPKYLAEFTPNYTGSAAAYKPYSTTKSKIEAWTPVAKAR